MKTAIIIGAVILVLYFASGSKGGQPGNGAPTSPTGGNPAQPQPSSSDPANPDANTGVQMNATNGQVTSTYNYGPSAVTSSGGSQ